MAYIQCNKKEHSFCSPWKVNSEDNEWVNGTFAGILNRSIQLVLSNFIGAIKENATYFPWKDK